MYEISKGKEKVVAALKKSIRAAEAVYLATDPDREGEAIAWHITQAAGIPPDSSPALLASGVDFVLEGLYALKKIGRSEERGYHATESPVRRPSREEKFRDEERTIPSIPQGKKKYYN